MAENKNRIMVYRDWIGTFDSLTDEEAGKLIKHLFRYVNDLNPEAPDRLTMLLFEPFKRILKRDLKAYEGKCLKNKENVDKRWNKENTDVYDRINDDTNHTDIDIDIDIDKKEDNRTAHFDFKKALVGIGVDETIATEWMKVRRTRKAVNSEIAFKAIEKEIKLTGAPPNECIKKAVEKSWRGFEAEWYLNAKPAPKKYELSGPVYKPITDDMI